MSAPRWPLVRRNRLSSEPPAAPDSGSARPAGPSSPRWPCSACRTRGRSSTPGPGTSGLRSGSGWGRGGRVRVSSEGPAPPGLGGTGGCWARAPRGHARLAEQIEERLDRLRPLRGGGARSRAHERPEQRGGGATGNYEFSSSGGVEFLMPRQDVLPVHHVDLARAEVDDVRGQPRGHPRVHLSGGLGGRGVVGGFGSGRRGEQGRRRGLREGRGARASTQVSESPCASFRRPASPGPT